LAGKAQSRYKQQPKRKFIIMEILILFVLNLAAAALFMSAGWIVSLVKRNAAVADIFWGPGFVLVAWLTFFQAEGYFIRKLLLALMVTVWGLRLFIHIAGRSRGKGEDPRYAAWRAQYGENFWIVSLYRVFLVQALFLWIIALGVQYGQVAALPNRLTWLDGAGFLTWTAGLIIESVSDYQLRRFLSVPENRGRVMDQGLWRYSRHPNYFGEVLIWWGIFVMVLSCPLGFFTIVSPLVITYTLLKLTGVSLMEETEFSDNPEYQAYIGRTSAFVPWFPRNRQKKGTDHDK
jgi:steroid 5-alpha reductase family enzyme